MRHIAVLAVAVTSMLSMPAIAMSTASASLGPLSLTLYDLNPNDSVVPSITFHNLGGRGSFADAYANDIEAGQVSLQVLWGAGPWDPLAAATSDVANVWSSASVSGSGAADGTFLSASGTALGHSASSTWTGPSQFQSDAYAPRVDYPNGGFTLSAYTSLVVSASSTAGASVTQVFDPAKVGGMEYSAAQAGLHVWAYDGHTVSQNASDYAMVSVSSKYYDTSPPCKSMLLGYCLGPDAASVSRTLEVSFVNDTSAVMDGYLEDSAQVWGYTHYYIDTVPEPATAALMLAGLAATALVARRCRT